MTTVNFLVNSTGKNTISQYYSEPYLEIEVYLQKNFQVRVRTSLNLAGFIIPHLILLHTRIIEVKSMQRSGTEATRTEIQPSKPKWEITYITNCQNTRRTHRPSEQLFPKRWPLSNRNRTKKIMNSHKVKCHRNSKTGNRESHQNYRLGTVSNELLGGLNMFYGANLALTF